MSASPNHSTSRPRLFKVLVGGLPFGLALLGALSFVFYFNKREREAGEKLVLAGALQRELNREDFTEYERILVDFFGPRPAGDSEAIRKVANYLESTLGPRNMGYEARQLAADAVGGGTRTHVVAALDGLTSPSVVVDVVAPIDTTLGPDDTESETAARDLLRSSRALAALLCLANRFSGEPRPVSLRFIAYVDGGDGYDPGFDRALALQGRSVAKVIATSTHFGGTVEHGRGDEGGGEPTDLMPILRELEAEILQATEPRSGQN